MSKTWNVYTVVFGTHFSGQVTADTKQEAEEMAQEIAGPPSLCHQCDFGVGLEIDMVYVEEDNESDDSHNQEQGE